MLNACPNTIFMTPIPNYGLEKIAGFRTVRLVGSLLKVLSVVLASQLKELMKYIMLHFRGAFVQERKGLDGVLGCIDSKKKERQTGFGIDIDMEKKRKKTHIIMCSIVVLYYFSLQRMGFREKWS